MGLDSFWKMPEETKDNHPKHPEFNPPLQLCGGMLSGSGQSSFRGKVYAGLIHSVTGVDIYQETISNDTIKKMAEKLDKEDFDFIHEFSDEECNDMVRMFRAYADAGATLHGWW